MILTEKNVELAIMSKLILDEGARDKLTSQIHPDFFMNTEFKDIYAERFKSGDFTEIQFELHRLGCDGDIVEKLYSVDHTAINTEELVKFYRNVFANRLILDGLEKAKGNKDYKQNLTALKELEETVENIDTTGSGIILPNEALDLYMMQLEENQRLLRENPDGIVGIPTGSAKLDEVIEGIGHQDYVLIAARPSMGKTSAVIKMFVSALLDEDLVSVIFSLETPVQDMIARIITQINTDIKLKHALFGREADRMNEQIQDVVAMLRTKKMYIEDFHKASKKESVKPTPALFASRLREIEKIEGSIGMVIVDHIGLMSATKTNLQEGNQTVTSISRDLRMMTRQFKCPFIVLSQLNRELEKRVDKRPKLSDLRDSGALEQDADKIIFIYRDYIYRVAEIKEMMKAKPGDLSLQTMLNQLIQQEFDAAEFLVAKNRNGPLGVIDLFFERKNASFTDDIDEFDTSEMFGNQEIYARDQ